MGLPAQINYSEVGMTEVQAKECGVLAEWQANPPPSVDRELRTCGALAGPERLKCWLGVESDVMEKVVPWVPYLWGPPW